MESEQNQELSKKNIWKISEVDIMRIEHWFFTGVSETKRLKFKDL